MRVLMTMYWESEGATKGTCTDTRVYEGTHETVASVILEYQLAHASTVRYTIERLDD